MNLYLNNLSEIHLSLKSVSLTACGPHEYVNLQSFWVPATVREFSSFAFIFSPCFVISSAEQSAVLVCDPCEIFLCPFIPFYKESAFEGQLVASN